MSAFRVIAGMGCSTGENASLAAEVPTEIDNRLFVANHIAETADCGLDLRNATNGAAASACCGPGCEGGSGRRASGLLGPAIDIGAEPPIFRFARAATCRPTNQDWWHLDCRQISAI